MQIALRSIDSIRPYERNPRKNDAAVDKVAASIREFGFRQPIVVDGRGVIVVGHTRYKAAIKLGLKKVPVHVAADLSAKQVAAYRLADNALNEIASWDMDALPQEVIGLKESGFDINLLGFPEERIDQLLEKAGSPPPFVEDEAPPVGTKAVARPGDVWTLGSHRLACGDSTRAADVDVLVRSEPANMLFTDPPWNVAIGKDSNPRHRQREGLRNDDMSSEQFAAFLSAFIAQAIRVTAGDLYVVLGASEWPSLDLAMRGAGCHWSATIIWTKDVFVLGRSKFHRRYEPIWYGWGLNSKSSFCGRRDLDDVWEIARPRRSEERPTMKPVELGAKAILASSRRGNTVLDLFGGSGSTLIGCEQTERACRMMELDPLYCDVIVARWEKFTGKKADRVRA